MKREPLRGFQRSSSNPKPNPTSTSQSKLRRNPISTVPVSPRNTSPRAETMQAALNSPKPQKDQSENAKIEQLRVTQRLGTATGIKTPTQIASQTQLKQDKSKVTSLATKPTRFGTSVPKTVKTSQNSSQRTSPTRMTSAISNQNNSSAKNTPKIAQNPSANTTASQLKPFLRKSTSPISNLNKTQPPKTTPKSSKTTQKVDVQSTEERKVQRFTPRSSNTNSPRIVSPTNTRQAKSTLQANSTAKSGYNPRFDKKNVQSRINQGVTPKTLKKLPSSLTSSPKSQKEDTTYKLATFQKPIEPAKFTATPIESQPSLQTFNSEVEDVRSVSTLYNSKFGAQSASPKRFTSPSPVKIDTCEPKEVQKVIASDFVERQSIRQQLNNDLIEDRRTLDIVQEEASTVEVSKIDIESAGNKTLQSTSEELNKLKPESAVQNGQKQADLTKVDFDQKLSSKDTGSDLVIPDPVFISDEKTKEESILVVGDIKDNLVVSASLYEQEETTRETLKGTRQKSLIQKECDGVTEVEVDRKTYHTQVVANPLKTSEISQDNNPFTNKGSIVQDEESETGRPTLRQLEQTSKVDTNLNKTNESLQNEQVTKNQEQSIGIELNIIEDESPSKLKQDLPISGRGQFTSTQKLNHQLTPPQDQSSVKSPNKFLLKSGNGELKVQQSSSNNVQHNQIALEVCEQPIITESNEDKRSIDLLSTPLTNKKTTTEQSTEQSTEDKNAQGQQDKQKYDLQEKFEIIDDKGKKFGELQENEPAQSDQIQIQRQSIVEVVQNPSINYRVITNIEDTKVDQEEIGKQVALNEKQFVKKGPSQRLINIQTPSFTSSQMRRKSDILLKMKEASARGRPSLDRADEKEFEIQSLISQGQIVTNLRQSYEIGAQECSPKNDQFGVQREVNRSSINNLKPNHQTSSFVIRISTQFSPQKKRESLIATTFSPCVRPDFAAQKQTSQFGENTANNWSKKSRKSIRKSTLANTSINPTAEHEQTSGFVYYYNLVVNNFFACCNGAKNTDTITNRTSLSAFSSQKYSFVAVPNTTNQIQDSQEGFSNSILKHKREFQQRRKVRDFRHQRRMSIDSFTNTRNPVIHSDSESNESLADVKDTLENGQQEQYLSDLMQQPLVQQDIQIIADDKAGDSDQIDSESDVREEEEAVFVQALPDARRVRNVQTPGTKIDSCNNQSRSVSERQSKNDSQISQQVSFEKIDLLENTQIDQEQIHIGDQDLFQQKQKQTDIQDSNKKQVKQKRSLKDLVTKVPFNDSQNFSSTKKQPVSQRKQINMLESYDSLNMKDFEEESQPQLIPDSTVRQIEEYQTAIDEAEQVMEQDLVIDKDYKFSLENKNSGSEQENEQLFEQDIIEEGEEANLTPDVQKLHFNQTVQSLLNIRASNLQLPPLDEIRHLMVNLPKPDHPLKTKTIIFDLDETLIHCVDDAENDNPQLIIPITFPEDPEPVMAGVNIRPYARECLQAANKHFQVVVFTASEKDYADPIIDYLDPDGSLIQARFYRQSCVRTSNPDLYVKDLRIFHQRSLADIVLVDNSVYSFAFQLDNGVPIVNYYQDPNDEEMLHLQYYLDCLKDCDDVRVKNREAFQLNTLAESQMDKLILEQQQQMMIQQAEMEQDRQFGDTADADHFGGNQQYAPPQYIGNQAAYEDDQSEEEDMLL